ncbi:2Fe-2S iron-sulfur cluster binding domain-containing protein [Pseudodesulfovibrio sp. zrk46]|uniref:2Fe-2S iron-sulfur cluster binding domain-containing protein n=1 Tax=Pseudodesulfovibrio sp. zrk46 TaxID=2725288 RepID=UPI0014497359|nr:2Fe-2S iron-sulfur cluster binding domain-containing protein [Pseudodesulfovibrio sp. zrk46]QJB57557.1 2Fe-2S iron-sulfur cluster binding domain-containing protein [Pseudodesulfovibrio sp. zrk46]
MYAYINGKKISLEVNETILEAARRSGHYIPTLCELADIDHKPGTCRVCLVEIRYDGKEEGSIVTACNTPILEGMEVFTRTRQVREMQRLQVELLLADHDQECATCVRHGSCEVQDVAQFVGLQKSRYYEPENADREVDETAPGFVRDMGKCIRCYRCVKICRDGQGVDALVMAGRGTGAGVGVRQGMTQGSSECVSCGQCVLVCPTGALGEKDETETVVDYLYDPDVVTVFQFAPAIRVGFGEEFGLPAGTNVEGQVISAIRAIGADVVLDTNFAADIVIMEEGTELLKKHGEGNKPLFTSCCPAWINFAEKHYPQILPHLSSTRSPQQCFGSIAKTYLPEKMDIDPSKVRVISIMPCIAKKDEAGRGMFKKDGMRDVDVVLTIREFARLLKREGIDLKSLEPSTFDNPYMGAYSGAGAIFATTGGVMEAAVRTMYYAVNDKELEEIEVEALRGFEGVRSAKVDLGGNIGEVKLAMCHGLKGVRAVVEDVLAGRSDFDFIEVMACPGGCVDGGGHLRSKKAYLPFALKRRDTLYKIDKKSQYRQSHNNPLVQKLYDDFLERPLSQKSHELLHTHYIGRQQKMKQTIRDIWKDITMSTLVHSEFDNIDETAACKSDIL